MRAWYPAMNKFRDQTRTAHLLNLVDGKAICGARPFSFGGGDPVVERTGSLPCRGCLKVARARGIEHSFKGIRL